MGGPMGRKLPSRIACGGMLAVLLLSLGGPLPAAAASRTLDPNTQFFNPLIPDAAYNQINELIAAGRRPEAELIRKMEEQPRAVWFTQGTPKQVAYKVSQTVGAANKKG